MNENTAVDGAVVNHVAIGGSFGKGDKIVAVLIKLICHIIHDAVVDKETVINVDFVGVDGSVVGQIGYCVFIAKCCITVVSYLALIDNNIAFDNIGSGVKGACYGTRENEKCFFHADE